MPVFEVTATAIFEEEAENAEIAKARVKEFFKASALDYAQPDYITAHKVRP